MTPTIFDTDILIFFNRQSEKALKVIEGAQNRCISAQTFMEYVQGVKNKFELQNFKSYLQQYEFKILAITEAISNTAMELVESYALSSALFAGDALIAATALHHRLPLVSSNKKHFQAIPELQLKVFKP